MGILARLGGRRPTAFPEPDPTAAATAPMSAVSVSVIRTANTGGAPSGPAAGVVQGWAGLGVLLPANYQGAFSGSPVSMRGGMVPGLQLRGGTEGLSSGWAVAPPMAGSAVPGTGNSWAGHNPVPNGAGLQRIGGAVPSSGLGQITSRRMRAQITRAQIAQSGASAMGWAQSLSPIAGS